MKLLIDGYANMDVDIEARTGLAARKMLRLGGWSEVMVGNCLLDSTPVLSAVGWAVMNNCLPERVTLVGKGRPRDGLMATLAIHGYVSTDGHTYTLKVGAA